MHTWSWLDGWEHARVFLMIILLISLIGMGLTGLALIVLLKNRTMTKKRKIHRFISIIVWVPVLMFSISGVYHLLHSAYSHHDRGLKLGRPITISPYGMTHSTAWLNRYEGLKLNAISIVKGPMIISCIALEFQTGNQARQCHDPSDLMAYQLKRMPFT